MLKDLQQFISYLSKKNPEEKSFIISQVLKNERLRRSYTLQELADGICSISSLYKIENSPVDIDSNFIRVICEKLKIDINKVKDCNDECLEKCLIAYYFRNYDEIVKFHKHYLSIPNNAITSIVDCFYYLVSKDYRKLVLEIKKLDVIKLTLGYFDGVIFLYIVILYFIETYQFKEAFSYLKRFDEVVVTNYYLKALIKESYLVCSFYLKKGSLLVNAYNDFQNEFILSCSYDKCIEFKMLYYAFVCCDYEKETKKVLEAFSFNDIKSNSYSNILYYNLLIKLNYLDYKELFDEVMHNSYYSDGRILGIIALLAYKINEKHYYNELSCLLKQIEFKEYDKIHFDFCNFVLMHFNSDPKLNNFLKEKLFKSNSKYYLYDEIYYKYYLHFLGESRRYKEVYNLVCFSD